MKHLVLFVGIFSPFLMKGMEQENRGITINSHHIEYPVETNSHEDSVGESIKKRCSNREPRVGINPMQTIDFVEEENLKKEELRKKARERQACMLAKMHEKQLREKQESTRSMGHTLKKLNEGETDCPASLFFEEGFWQLPVKQSTESQKKSDVITTNHNGVSVYYDTKRKIISAHKLFGKIEVCASKKLNESKIDCSASYGIEGDFLFDSDTIGLISVTYSWRLQVENAIVEFEKNLNK